jgi:hypothetical protein
MSNEDEEVAALDRVLTRTVLTKDEDLQQVGRKGHRDQMSISMCLIATDISIQRIS